MPILLTNLLEISDKYRNSDRKSKPSSHALFLSIFLVLSATEMLFALRARLRLPFPAQDRLC